ncbi:hypothetical protein BX666DRAFT_1849131 [Dichotomocladium elegans]|nr:hypothetical protein BX666DRAFT_1849131 [Dichotomocladium elegans]
MSLTFGEFLSPGFRQAQDLRQVDPMSPVLFNLVLETLLIVIFNDSSFQGIQPSISTSSLPIAPPRPLKCLACARGVLVFLADSSHLDCLHFHLANH